MAQRIGGIAFLKINGSQYPLRGNFQVSPSVIERTGIAGQDGIHGFMVLPKVPFIQGDVSLTSEVSIDILDGFENATVTAELSNGKVYVLSGAWSKAGQELNTHDGQTQVRFEGRVCTEYTA